MSIDRRHVRGGLISEYERGRITSPGQHWWPSSGTPQDLGGPRIVSDPTLDDPGPHGYLTKTAGPAVTEEQRGPVDLVLVSHDNHPDNLRAVVT